MSEGKQSKVKSKAKTGPLHRFVRCAAVLLVLAVAIIGKEGVVTEEEKETKAQGYVDAICKDGLVAEVYAKLASGGHLCKSVGHDWASGCGMYGCLVIHTAPMRHCSRCGFTEHAVWK